jgi:hypothetical protein
MADKCAIDGTRIGYIIRYLANFLYVMGNITSRCNTANLVAARVGEV